MLLLVDFYVHLLDGLFWHSNRCSDLWPGSVDYLAINLVICGQHLVLDHIWAKLDMCCSLNCDRVCAVVVALCFPERICCVLLTHVYLCLTSDLTLAESVLLAFCFPHYCAINGLTHFKWNVRWAWNKYQNVALASNSQSFFAGWTLTCRRC